MIKLFRSISGRNLLALGALTIALAPQALRAEGQCSNATMKGTYVASGTGMVASANTFAPIASVGLIIYNGDGTGMSVFSTKTVGGQASTSSNVPATFTVNPDCTGSKTIGATNFNFVITPDGSKITYIVTNPGVTLMGTGVRMSFFLNPKD
jgi:hypothetical protein